MQSDSDKKKWAVTQLVYSEILAEIDSFFTELKIPYIPIKGAYLVASRLSEKLSFRIMTDIDILVNHEDLKTVTVAMMHTPNFKLIRSYQENIRQTETICHYVKGDVEVTVEFMSAINSPNRFVLSSVELFARAISMGGEQFFPSKEDALLIMLCHLHTHIAFEFRDTTFSEMAVLIEGQQLDWDLFNHLSSKTGMARFVNLMLAYYSTKRDTHSFGGPLSLYSFILLHIIGFDRVLKQKRLIKRLLLDLPYVRSPFLLVLTSFYRARVANYGKNK